MRVVVRGDVQGVGYRDATVRQALQLGLMGWVRNDGDDDVLVHAEGPEQAVDELVSFLGRVRRPRASPGSRSSR